MLKGGMNSAGMTKPHGINISSSAYGRAVKLLYGLCQAAPDLVWYNDWRSSDHPSNANLASVLGAGGKKKTTKKGGIKYYSAAVDLLLGHAPVRGVFTAWYNNLKLAVVIGSASGVISGGQFSFTPTGGASETVVDAFPTGPSFLFTAPNFVADRRVRDATLGDNFYLQRSDPAFAPGPNQYTVTSGGLYTFNATQGGHHLRVTYFKTVSGSAATLAGLLAATIHEDFGPVTFNDYGGPGSITEWGTWERPLWNAGFPVPGRIDAGAYRARDPYTWWGDGSTPTANFPAALNGQRVTVYYGTPIIFKSDGTFFSNAFTPLGLLNLEFEQAFAGGSQYGAHTDQQIVQEWCAGVGSLRFDLSMANAMPNLNLEVIGAFTQWPNGDADVADVIADIVASGPVLP